jgi:hypothetical protein
MGLVKAFQDTRPGEHIIYRAPTAWILILPIRYDGSMRVDAEVHVRGGDGDVSRRAGEGKYEHVESDDWVDKQEQRLIDLGIDPDHYDNVVTLPLDLPEPPQYT